MAIPQRHRLLQGYPMAPLMRPLSRGKRPEKDLQWDLARPLIVGVIPHPFCNPSLTGCGFCTFPHEKFRGKRATSLTRRVCDEIRQMSEQLDLRKRKVEAVYFGGGTANLTPAAELEELYRTLGQQFDLSNAEVTLEGVPIYFLTHDAASLRGLAALACRQRRISMGVQTFDPTWLEKMGRKAFGTREEIGRVVALAHQLGMTTSADLLINLPGQPLEQMRDDVLTALSLGFDQVCIYNLVLYAGLGTEWSKRREMVEAMPSVERACENWLSLRELLLEKGCEQTTLTNFERVEVHHSSKRFVYEASSFRPDLYDAIGFGPAAISTFCDSVTEYAAVKWINHGTADAYLEHTSRGEPRATVFNYFDKDLQLLHLTRGFSLTKVERAPYAKRINADVLQDFGEHVELFVEKKLLEISPEALQLTPRGMFFADSVTGLLAAEQVMSRPHLNDSRRHSMG
jgi:oxygen-independent coproporphyrinogen-3 oxidase